LGIVGVTVTSQQIIRAGNAGQAVSLVIAVGGSLTEGIRARNYPPQTVVTGLPVVRETIILIGAIWN